MPRGTGCVFGAQGGLPRYAAAGTVGGVAGPGLLHAAGLSHVVRLPHEVCLPPVAFTRSRFVEPLAVRRAGDPPVHIATG